MYAPPIEYDEFIPSSITNTALLTSKKYLPDHSRYFPGYLTLAHRFLKL